MISFYERKKMMMIRSYLSKIAVLDRIALAFIAFVPLFYMAIPHWITNISVLAFVFSIFAIWGKVDYKSIFRSNEILSILLIFIIYSVAIIISQFGLFTFSLRAYLDQTRWILGAPIFLFLLHKNINYSEILDWSLPICVLTAWISGVFIIPSNEWGNRATVSFIDPLTFGSTNLAIGAMCLASTLVDFSNKKLNFNTFLKLLAFFVAIYLSLRTGSRTGWFGLPIGLLLIFQFIYKKSFKNYFFAFGLVLTAAISIYFSFETFYVRINLALSELISYPWFGGVAPDNSVSLRITFYRLGAFYFSKSPLFGWGDQGYSVVKDSSELMLFSTQYARDFAFKSLFHSEWVTQAVRYGVLGVFSVLCVFWIPLKSFYKFQKLNTDLLKVSCMGTVYMTCQLAASFSTEIYNSKATTSFTAIIVGGLLASGLSLAKKDSVGHRN